MEEANPGPELDVRHETLIIIPTLNEAANIADLVHRIAAAASDADLLIVDDQSSDGTPMAARQAFRGRPGYAVWTRTGRRGLGRAYTEAFQHAVALGYDFAVQMDADLSHDPAALPALRGALRDADLVIGSRYCTGGGIAGWAPHRVWLSRFANLYARNVTGLGIADITAGYRAWRTSALRRLELGTVASAGYSIQVELAVRAHCAGLRIRETPIVFTDRCRGESKMNLGVLLESVYMPWRLRAYARRLRREGTWRGSW